MGLGWGHAQCPRLQHGWSPLAWIKGKGGGRGADRGAEAVWVEEMGGEAVQGRLWGAEVEGERGQAEAAATVPNPGRGWLLVSGTGARAVAAACPFHCPCTQF